MEGRATRKSVLAFASEADKGMAMMLGLDIVVAREGGPQNEGEREGMTPGMSTEAGTAVSKRTRVSIV